MVDNINVIYSHSVHGDDLMDAFKKLDPKDTGFIRWVKNNLYWLHQVGEKLITVKFIHIRGRHLFFSVAK